MRDMHYHKERTQDLAIHNLPLALVFTIPLSQHAGKVCKPIVKVKDRVLRGQVLASGEGPGVYAPIHAPISGEVLAIKNAPHPALGTCLAIQIKNDGLDEAIETIKLGSRNLKEVEALSIQELRDLIFEAGIVGLGGAAFPTHIKLNPPKSVDTLIINGAECEPYLTSDYRLMLESSQEIASGIKIMAKILGAKDIYLAIEDNKPRVIEIFNRLASREGFKVRVLKTVYPQGGEKQLTQAILRKEVPSGGLPFDIGVVVQNVASAFAVYEDIYLRKPLYERVVTVCGTPLENPKNLRVRVGTPVRNLLEACGPIKKEIRKMIIGGPMMGIAQDSFDTPIIKSSGGVIVFSEDEIFNKEERVCCRCGRCIDVCPVRIMPALIAMASEKERWDIAKTYDPFDCIECGLCSFACPAKRDLVQLIKYAKVRVKR